MDGYGLVSAYADQWNLTSHTFGSGLLESNPLGIMDLLEPDDAVYESLDAKEKRRRVREGHARSIRRVVRGLEGMQSAVLQSVGQ